MIIDITDQLHLYKELEQEIHPLLDKKNLIISQLKKKNGNRGVYKESRKSSTYKRPKGIIEWKIFYKIPIQKELTDIEFFPICKIDIENMPYYVNINMIRKSSTIIRVFSGHFIKRLKERAKIEYETTEEYIASFYWDGKISIHNYWNKKNNEMRYLNKFGFSIGRYDKNSKIAYFDTFVTKEMLHDDQKEWVKDLLSESIKYNTEETNRYMYEFWEEYMDINEIYTLGIKDAIIKNISGGGKKAEKTLQWLKDVEEKNKLKL